MALAKGKPQLERNAPSVQLVQGSLRHEHDQKFFRDQDNSTGGGDTVACPVSDPAVARVRDDDSLTTDTASSPIDVVFDETDARNKARFATRTVREACLDSYHRGTTTTLSADTSWTQQPIQHCGVTSHSDRVDSAAEYTEGEELSPISRAIYGATPICEEHGSRP